MFKVGITRNCIEQGNAPGLFDPRSFEPLRDCPDLDYAFIADKGPLITAAEAASHDAIFALQPRIAPDAFAKGDHRLRLLVLSGSGYDTVDIDACTRAGVLVTNTPDAVTRSVATSILAFMLALSHRLMIKDRLTRNGGWAERTHFMGYGLTGKIVGSIGFGLIARESFRLMRPLDVTLLATSPRGDPTVAAAENVRLVDFETLLRQSDFVCVNCPLKPETRHLVDAPALSRMKPSAFLINTSRGPVVDEKALYEALVNGRIAGAALDVFEQEPVARDNPLFALDNVIVTPHAMALTDECFRRVADRAIAAIVAFQRGSRPSNILNADALHHPRLRSPGRQDRGEIGAPK